MTVTHIHVDLDLDSLDAQEVLAAIPYLTYRQLDYWTTTGRIHTIGSGHGSGIHRRWSPDQVAIASRMLWLTNLGVNVDTAQAIATDRRVLMELMAELTKIEAELDT